MSPRFTSPPDPVAFNHTVWDLVRQIPEGRVATYGQIASLIPVPAEIAESDYRAWGARWVGGAMSACPEDVPWQRVINAQGKISLRKGAGYIRQRQLLEDEGIEFDQRERVDFKQYGWAGPSEEWLQSHGLGSTSEG